MKDKDYERDRGRVKLWLYFIQVNIKHCDNAKLFDCFTILDDDMPSKGVVYNHWAR